MKFCLFKQCMFLTCVFLMTQISSGITVCSDGQYYFKDKCYSNCTVQVYVLEKGNSTDVISQLYIKTEGSSVCVETCSVECQTCSKYADFCDQCKINSPGVTVFLLEEEGKCFSLKCPPLYYQNIHSKRCQSCQILSRNCKVCATNYQCTSNGGSQTCDLNNEIICKQCDSGFYTFSNASNYYYLECLTQVPEGYININQNITQCQSSCLTCVGYRQNCLNCKALNLFNLKCIGQCPSSHYSKQKTILFNGHNVGTLMCQRCQLPCNTCYNSTFCLSCSNYTYLVQSQGLCVKLELCPEGTYPNTTIYKCQPCENPCRRCYNQNQCKQCTGALTLSQKQCVTICPNRTFPIQITDSSSLNQKKYICQACFSPCESCQNQIVCLSCLKQLSLLYFYEQKKCVQNCPDGYKPDSKHLNCQLCLFNCSKCNQTACTQCKIVNGTKYYIFGGQCIQSCPLAYYSYELINSLDGSSKVQCKLCSKQCQTCHNQTYCIKCHPSYYFFPLNNSCLQTCPQTEPVQTLIQPASSLMYQCKPCGDQFCVSCTKRDYCLACMSFSSQVNQTIALFQGNCLIYCPQNYQKVYSQTLKIWYCLYIQKQQQEQQNQTITVLQSQTRGIVLTIHIPYLASYVSAGILVLTGLIFLLLYLCSYNKGLFLPFLSGLLIFPQTFITAFSLYYHLTYNYYDYFQRFKFKAEIYVLAISVLILLLLNLINLIIFCKIMYNDMSFQHWKSHKSIGSKVTFILFQALSIINFKAQNIFWSKFAHFPVLQNVQKLRYFAVISGIGTLPTLGMIISFLILAIQQEQIRQIYYDGIAVLCLSSLVNLLSLKRPKDLFVFKANNQGSLRDESYQDFKFDLHKRTYDADALYVETMRPTTNLQQIFKPKNSKYEQLQNQNIGSQRSINSSKRLRNYQTVSQNVISSKGPGQPIFYRQEVCQSNTLQNSLDQSILNVDMRNKQSMSHNFICQKMLISKTRNRDSERLYFSLSGIQGQSRSQIQTDQTSQRVQLNEAISKIEQGSYKVEMRSLYQEQFPNDFCHDNVCKIQVTNLVKIGQIQVQRTNQPTNIIQEPIKNNSEPLYNLQFIKLLDISQSEHEKQPAQGINSNRGILQQQKINPASRIMYRQKTFCQDKSEQIIDGNRINQMRTQELYQQDFQLQEEPQFYNQFASKTKFEQFQNDQIEKNAQLIQRIATVDLQVNQKTKPHDEQRKVQIYGKQLLKEEMNEQNTFLNKGQNYEQSAKNNSQYSSDYEEGDKMNELQNNPNQNIKGSNQDQMNSALPIQIKDKKFLALKSANMHTYKQQSSINSISKLILQSKQLVQQIYKSPTSKLLRLKSNQRYKSHGKQIINKKSSQKSMEKPAK